MTRIEVTRRLLTRLVLAFLVLACWPPMARAQYSEGSLVQAEDGSLYVFEGGQLHAIQPVAARPEDLAATPIGAPVPQGVAIIWPPAQVAEVPVAVPTGLSMTVLSVERPFRGSRNPSSGREWTVVRVRIENQNAQAWNTGPFAIGNPSVFVVDGRGSSIAVSTLTIPEGVRPSTAVPPGGSIEGTLAFEVPIGIPIAKIQWFERGSLLMEADIP
jgi:hypothetical protein